VRVYFHTFGCKANQYDTERMRQEVEARGATTVEDRSEADLCVVNTCTVTNQADAEARRFVRRLGRDHPRARVVVAGCSAVLRARQFRAMPEVAAVVEGHDPVAVAAAAAPPVSLELRNSLDRIDTEPIGGTLLRRRAGSARAWLKIQDGCDRKCSFCATRLARGPSRSRAPEHVLDEALELSRAHAELVLTGIHIGHYGRDLGSHWTLSRLVDLLLDRVPSVRLRLGSVEATEVDDALVDLLATSEGRLAPHLHMPLQSGSDSVLRAMRRWHTREQYRARTLEIAGRVGVLGLGADVITGFPGETEADHEATLELVEELPFTYLHVFPWSPRAGTTACDLPGFVPQRVAGERSRELRATVHEKALAHRRSRVGTQARVVIEGTSGTALTGDYLRVKVGSTPRTAPRVLEGTLGEDGDHLYIAWPRESPSYSIDERS
jgi:threonylcarbamoyladenosine tRNA methylthiotransferase MtaB